MPDALVRSSGRAKQQGACASKLLPAGCLGGRRLEIPEVHNLLTDQADWDAETWDMDPQGLEELAATLDWLFEQLRGDVTFQTTWSDPIEHHVRLSRGDLLAIVPKSEIGTRRRYYVSA
jgi:hypothetical protein